MVSNRLAKINIERNYMPEPLFKMNSREGQNTRIHPQILRTYKQLSLDKEVTVWDLVNQALLSDLKRRKACPKDWSLKS